MLTKSRLITVGMAVLAVAALYRTDQGQEFLTGETKFLGIF